MHFIAKTYTCGQKLAPGGLIDPLGAKNVKRMGFKNLAGVQSPTPSHQLVLWLYVT